MSELNKIENKLFQEIKDGELDKEELKSIINSFLEMLPRLRKELAPKSKIRECESCQEPAAKKICSMCELLGEYRQAK